MALGRTSDFTPIASRYDATRDIPRGIIQRLYRRLGDQGLLSAGASIIDVGCGTGQISLPLAEAGYLVRGYDISAAMVTIAQEKRAPGWRATYAVADARTLPEPSNSCDAVVVSKLFMHIEDWRLACSECIRILKPSHCFIHIRDRGWFGNAVRRHFASRADALGYPDRFPGLTRIADMVEHLVKQGCDQVIVDVSDLKWAATVRLGDMLDQFRERLFAEFWYLPGEVYDRILTDTARFVKALPDSAATTETMSAYLAVEVFRKPV